MNGCPECAGEGLVNEDCHRCDGTGTSEEICLACHGTGEVEEETPNETEPQES